MIYRHDLVAPALFAGSGVLSLEPTKAPGLALGRPALPRADAAGKTPSPVDDQRLHGLDGLRGLAVLAVVLYHLELPGLFEAGFLGVDVFFTLSGFLITTLLLREHAAKGRVDFYAFYYRRARRLLPVMIALVCAVFAITVMVAPDALDRLVADMPAAYLYLSNWWQITSQQSYFEKAGRPPLLQHLWSLAVEVQYYIVWPPVLLLLVRWRGAAFAAAVALALAIASTVWMGWICWSLPAGADPSRAYLGSDTHAMGLLIGSALGCLLERCKGRAIGPIWRSCHAVVAPLMQVAGVASLALLAYLVCTTNEATPTLYFGGFLMASVLSAIVILSLNDQRAWVTVMLSQQPLRWLGTRSYSIYLWHWPISLWVRSGPELGFESAGMTWLKVALTLLASELSYQLLERAWLPAIKAGVKRAAQFFSWSYALSAIPVLVYVFVSFVSMTAPVMADLPVPTGIQLISSRAMLAHATKPPRATHAFADDRVPMTLQFAGAGTRVAVPRSGREIVVIGDSVMLGASPTLNYALPGISVNAVVGRQFSEALRVVSELREKSLLPDTVVLHLGTNGYIAEKDLRALLRYLKDRHLVVVNVHANRRWTERNNEIIERVLGESPQVALIRWNELSRGRSAYFARDGIHLTGRGAAAMAAEVARSATRTVATASAPEEPVPATGKAALANATTSAPVYLAAFESAASVLDDMTRNGAHLALSGNSTNEVKSLKRP